MEYLKIAQDLEMYGVNYFTIRVCGSPCEFLGRRWRRNQGQTAKMGPSWSQGGRYLAGSVANKGRGRGEGLRASVSILGLQLDAR